ncbi:MAG: ATP-dependent DNA helicase RecG, partial [Parvibaculaceae bacterium]|nr:ATP-dependent DNA helicase RecG [Parvibaculaceae bacterium]
MRPEILFPLFKSVTSLPGIGPRMEKRVEDLAGPHVADLCWHLPAGLVDRRYQPKIADAKEGEIATIKVNIGSHIAPPSGNKRLPYRVWVNDDSGDMALVFFHARPDYLH